MRVDFKHIRAAVRTSRRPHPCPRCKGEAWWACFVCDGWGYLTAKRWIEIETARVFDGFNATLCQCGHENREHTFDALHAILKAPCCACSCRDFTK